MITRFIRSRRRKSKFVSFIDPLFLKDRNKVLFVVKDKTYFSGNIRVTLETFLEQSDKKVYLYKDGKCNTSIQKTLEAKNVTVLSGFSLKAVWHIVTSGVLILSHNPRDTHITQKFKGRKIINLWHGVAIKNIELLMSEIDEEKYKLLLNNSKLYDMIIASSEEDRKTNAKVFGVLLDKVKVTGLPRYEILKDSYHLDGVLKHEEGLIKSIKGDKKLVLYAPTFRECADSPFKQIEPKEWKQLSLFAEKNNFIFAIRPHPYDTVLEYLKNDPNIYVFEASEYTETNLLLRYVDVLIVDFSSIWIDFLLLKRPIIGFAKDYEYYLHRERGFRYNFKSIFPSSFAVAIDDLITYIEIAIHNSKTVEYTKQLRLFHKFNLQENFIKRVLDEI